MFGTCSGRVRNVFGTCLGRVWDVFGTCSGCVRDVFGMCSGRAREENATESNINDRDTVQVQGFCENAHMAIKQSNVCTV